MSGRSAITVLAAVVAMSAVPAGVGAAVTAGPSHPDRAGALASPAGKSGAGTAWSAIGPRAIPPAPAGAGKLQAFAVDLANPLVMYAGGGVGPGNAGPFSEAGLFKTVNGGASWQPADTGLGDPSACALWLDQQNPNVLTVGTWFSGIYRSADAGVTWRRVARLGATTGFLQVGSALYAATARGIARSVNAGATWTLIKRTTAPVRALAGSGRVLYAGLDDGTVLARSRAGWRRVLSVPAATVWSIAVSPANPRRVYAVEWNNYHPGDLYATTDGGRSWHRVLRRRAIQVVTFGVNDPSTVYAAPGGALLVSTNDGSAWTVHPGPDVRFLYSWPGRAGTIVVGSDQGLFLVTGYGAVTSSLNGDISSSLLTGLAVSGSEILTAVQDYSPLLSTDGGATWQQFWGTSPPVGEDGTAVFGPSGPTRAYLDTSVGFQYSADGGLTWQSASGLPQSQFSYAGSADLIGTDPASPATLYLATSSRVYRSTDSGASWAPAHWPIRQPSLVVVSPANGRRIYVGSQQSGALFYTTDGGSRWHRSRLTAAGGWPTALAVDPADPRVVLVGLANSAGTGGGVWRSTNGGASFTRADRGIAAGPTLAPFSVWSVGFQPNSARPLVAVATASGAFVSADRGARWQSIRFNAEPRWFTGIAWSGGYLYMSTYGEGVLRVPASRL